ncbi:hypothetical protein MMC20_002340 [Loxospora ochrophaea]|nr:hypothetical protein [Loxospora ochrophaea]
MFPIPYPAIFGLSFAGTVQDLGQGVTGFKIDDRVVVNRTGSRAADFRFGAYQKFPLAFEGTTVKLGPDVSFDDASATIMNLATAVSALAIHMKLSRPSLGATATPSNGKKILIYGGSSSVGGFAVKFASDAGYHVVTTSSPSNQPFVSSLGAAQVINHSQPTKELLAELESSGPYDAILDTISIPDTTNLIGELLKGQGGVFYATQPPFGPEKPFAANVERKFASYHSSLEEDANSDVGKWFFEKYLPQGLATGTVVPTRVAKIDGGLASVQGVLDKMMAGGISGKKLVLNPQ